MYKHNYNISKEDTYEDGPLFYYRCICTKCKWDHSAGYPKDVFKSSLHVGYVTENDFFFFLTNDMQVKMINRNGEVKEADHDCPYTDEDAVVKGIIE